MKFWFWLLATIVFLANNFCNKSLNAQYNSEYTQYVFNAVSLNPAYIGSRGVMSANAIYRNQFLTLSGGPINMAMTFNAPVNKSNNNLGIWIENDQFGIYKQIKLYGMYSFKAKINEKVTLNLGVQAGIKNYIFDNSTLLQSVNINPEFYTAINQENQVLPNVGAGAYLYANNFAVGLAAPHLIASSIFNVDSLEFNTLNHYFLTAGYIFPLSYQVKLKPTIIAKFLENAQPEISIGANFLINEAIWVSAIWRNYDAIDVAFEIQIDPQMRIGYAYDVQSRKIVGQSGSAHEILFGYDFAFTDKEIAMPRYF